MGSTTRSSPALIPARVCPAGAPILRTTGISDDAGGTPIEFGRTWFAGDRVTLTVGDD